ncbi:MAG: BrnT family toxin [Chloroflexi bacterium]|nr:BrnT family toxin [Chloroflexota bacterium]
MPYEWDEEKREETLRARGVDFDSIEHFDWRTALTRQSDRGGETRWVSSGFIGSRLYVVVSTMREEATRIISFRKANSREVDIYDNESTQDN